jgi:microcystin-dependent protein
MPHITENRVLETTTTTGTGAIALAAAVTGFRRFNAVCAVGDTTPYFIEAVDSVGMPSGDYEYGIGTYSAANTLTRTKVLGSSNAGAAVNFAAGSKNVGVAALGDGLVPVGASFDMTGSVVPSGYVEANGALLSRAAYPALWAYAQACGNIAASDGAWTGGQYSPGDGSTTFRVPDARGEFIRGWDHGRGVDSGRAIGSSQADDFEAHTHTIASRSISYTAGGVTDTVLTGAGATATNSTGGTETRPRNIAWMKIIKA